MEQRNPRHVIIGRRLEFLRRIVNNESREDLARHVEASPSAIRQWDCGQTIPSAENMIKVMEHYLVSLDYLWCVEFNGLSDDQLRALPASLILRRPNVEAKHFRLVATEVVLGR
jgi:transcriptional regulator with XRE-family HTH domain